MTYRISRIKTGIDGLDEMIDGGLPFPSTILVAGSAGTGKTTFGLQFLTKGADEGERGIYFATLSEPVQWLLRFTQDFKFMNKKYFGEEILYKDLGVFLKKANDFDGILKIIEDTIVEHMPQRIVIDPVTMISKWEGYRDFLFKLSVSLKNWETTTILTGETWPNEAYPIQVAYVVDGVIMLSTRLGREGARHKSLEVLKMRGTRHVTGAQLSSITDRGLQVQIGMGTGSSPL